MRIAVGNLKGGAAKTTTAVHLALGLAQRGAPTVLVDADPDQESASWWAKLAADTWPASVTVVPWHHTAGRTLGDYEHAVIDTGPKRPELLRSALRLVDTVVVPLSPRPADVAELSPSLDLVREVDQRHPLMLGVLLVQVRARTRSAADARTVVGEQMDAPVLDAEVPLRESYAQAYGTAPTDLGAYAAVLTELLES